MPDKNDLGSRIRSARERCGLSATQLADLLDMKGHTYRRYERDEVPMKATLLINIARQLNMSIDELVGIKPPEFKGRIIHHKIPGRKGTRIVLTLG